MTATENVTSTDTDLVTYEFKGRDGYGRTSYTLYARRPVHGYGQVAVITVLPKIAAREDGARHMVTDLRREIEWNTEKNVTVVLGLKAARALALEIAHR